MAKVSARSVKYSLGGDHCSACVNWVEDQEDEATETAPCRKVIGPEPGGRVREDKWCELFKRKHRRTIAGSGSE